MNTFNLKELENIGHVPNNTVINEDCFNVFPYIKDRSVDCIICDMPYG